MKASFRLLLLLFASAVLFSRCEKEPEPVQEGGITDPRFLEALIDNGVDTDGDGQISQEEAEAVVFLSVSYCTMFSAGLLILIGTK